jgi:hypothetical protein
MMPGHVRESQENRKKMAKVREGQRNRKKMAKTLLEE